MAQLWVKKIKQPWKIMGLPDDLAKNIKKTIDDYLTPERFKDVVHIVGWATLAFVLGCIVLPIFDETVPKLLWIAVGSGIGSLAGIFVANK
jgi:hypothetical protein